ncbi:MAG: HAMP domain-containing histidine kinase [Stomatobaculum sp.]|nr:HAMP domain-containing histidine kinase [Stomatobaculum sp.]
MIKKLRNKFILINMCFVSVILGVICVFLAVSFFQRNTQNTTFFLQNELWRAVQGNAGGYPSFRIQNFPGPNDSGGNPGERPREGIPEREGARRQRGYYLPYVILKVGSDGSVLNIDEHDLSMTEDSAAALVSLLPELSEEKKNAGGVLKQYDLRYALQRTPEGTLWVIFGDMSGESSAFRSFLFSLGTVLIPALLVFFLLSFWLARWALTPVEKAWDQQNRFVADASHELKTPITVILANLDILRSHKEDTVQSQMRWVRNTREEAERMRELVENLLFLAKNDADSLKVQMSEADLSELAQDRILNFEAVAFEKKVTLDSDIQEGLRITGNEGQLKQLFTILLDNAVKYAGQDGRVRVAMSPCQEKNGKNAVRIVVNNTGEAIPPEDLAHIFERFYRADKSRARSEGGYGLGLSIAESIVRMHHGRISCESTPQDGTTFTVTLPVA